MEVRTNTTDFTPRTSLEGSIISETGTIIIIAVIVFLSTEAIITKYKHVGNFE